MPAFTGAFAAAITPSRADTFQMDVAATLEVIDFLCSHHVQGIALFGATGEFPHFLVEDRIRLAHMAIKRSRVPVLVNATHTTYDDARTIVEHATSNGAAGVLLQPPHYFRYGAAEIRQFYREILNEFGSRIPILLYNLPAFNNEVPIQVAKEFLESGAAVGIKDSSGSEPYLRELLRLRAQNPFALLMGNDALTVRGRMDGADGFISGCAGAVPELMVALDHAITRNNATRIESLSALLDEFRTRIEEFPGPSGIRECLAARGFKVGMRAVPFAPETELRAAGLREWFKAWLPLMQKEATLEAPQEKMDA